jgi:hypothetical protein
MKWYFKMKGELPASNGILTWKAEDCGVRGLNTEAGRDDKNTWPGLGGGGSM